MDQEIVTKEESASKKVENKLRISILELTAENVRFLLHGADPNIADYMRRTFKMSTPTLAIDRAETVINTSNASSTYLARRLQNLVLTSDKTVEQLLYPQECNCGSYCPHCSVTLHVAVTSDGEERRVTFADVKSENADVKPVIVEHAGEVYKDNNLICKLHKNQTVNLKAFAVKGVGAQHPKWGPSTRVVQKMLKPAEAEGDESEGGTDAEVAPVMEFNVFSVGALKPENIVLMGLREMIKKFELIKNCMDQDPRFTE